jgi:hypothetical protein
MKRCPECNSPFPDTEKFCELDGTPLFENPDDPKSPRQFSLPVAASAGAVIGVLLVLIYLVLTHEKGQKPIVSSTSTSAVGQQQLPPRPMILAPESVPSPTIEPSPSPSPSVSPSPSIQPTPEQVKLSTDPISTTRGQNSGPLTIKLNTGVTIEADEAWQTSEGVWYRKGGMVSLLDPKDIKSVGNKSVR